jgi:hypothetical protein
MNYWKIKDFLASRVINLGYPRRSCLVISGAGMGPSLQGSYDLC